MDYRSTDFGADSSSSFRLTAPTYIHTDTQTDKLGDTTEQPTHATASAGVANDVHAHNHTINPSESATLRVIFLSTTDEKKIVKIR